MRKSCYERNDSIKCMCADVDARSMHQAKVSALVEHQHQHKCTGFESFLKHQAYACTESTDLSPNSYMTEKQNQLLMFVKNDNQIKWLLKCYQM